MVYTGPSRAAYAAGGYGSPRPIDAAKITVRLDAKQACPRGAPAHSHM